ncbi:MAG: histidine triad nucleotide-binding protein [Oligoflexales bacterium]
MSQETIFDKIIRDEIPVNIVYQDDYVIAFHDINPQAPVHVLVIPKKKYQGFSDLADADALSAGQYMTSISKVAKHLKLDNGYRIVFNQGNDGLQTVEYIHAHLLAGRQLQWPPG